MKSIAASLRGYYLRSWRYGPDTERIVEQALEREHWPRERWQAWQAERLAGILQRAATQVPYYRQYWSQRRRSQNTSWAYLENWPILEKETLRQNQAAFIADDCERRRMFADHTSGTTGTPLTIWLSRASVRTWYALTEARWRRWYGVTRCDRWAILGGQLVTPVQQRRPPFWVWNAGLDQLYLSSYHLAPDLVPYYLEALARYRIVYLYGYTSSLYTLAQEAASLGWKVPMKVVVTNAEPVYDYQRQVIQQTFMCPLRETYGMAEAVAAASECQSSQLHLWPEAGSVEVFEGDQPLPPGSVGDLVCTGLNNPDMPLIRYRVGDRGALSANGNECGCGRTLQRLASLAGRTNDILYTSDGRKIFWVNPVLYDLPLREAQIIQESLERVRVRYVPSTAFTPSAAQSIVERLQARLGPIEVELEAVEAIPRTASGKFRAVVSRLSPEQTRGLIQDH
jgi:phenylacetate-CoA ligase